MITALSRSHYLAIFIGVGYGVALRLYFDGNSILFGQFSFGLLVLVPPAIGSVTVLLADSARAQSLKWAIFLGPWISAFCFAVTSAALFRDSFWFFLAFPFTFLATLGGLVGWLVVRVWALRTGTLCVVLLTFLIEVANSRVR
jgi:hypothetical protein